MMGTRRPIPLAILVGVHALAGCTSGPDDTGRRPDEPTGGLEFFNIVWKPLVVNGTGDPGELEIDYYQDGPECPFRDEENLGHAYQGRVNVIVYDRAGRIFDQALDIDPDARRTHLRIPLSGSPPYMLAGDPNMCGDLQLTRAFNVTEGYMFPVERAAMHRSIEIDVSIPAGSLQGSSQWRPSPFAWELSQAYPLKDQRQGEEYGEIRLIDAEGTTTRSDRYSPVSSTTRFDPWMKVPGDYALELKLDAPALAPTTWTYHIDYFAFSSEVCAYGFEWNGLC